MLAGLLWVVLLTQAGVLPRLDRRARLIVVGGSLPGSRLHLAYATPDGIKVVLLPALGIALCVRRRGVRTSPTGRTSPGWWPSSTGVFTDEILGPVFLGIAEVDLAVHLPVMCDFWQTVLLRPGLYHRNALRHHADLTATVELTPAPFTRWLDLWLATVDERHTGKRRSLQGSGARIAGAVSR